MRGKLCALMCASALVVASGFLPLTTTNTSAVSCKDIEFVWARGSGSPLNAREGKMWRLSLNKQMIMQAPNLDWDFYELGSGVYNNTYYPAYKIGAPTWDAIRTALSAILSFAHQGRFNYSVEQGVQEFLGRAAYVNQRCPETKFVVGGYSQGAMVTSRIVQAADADIMAYAATFGDPVLYLPEGFGLWPDACKGKNLSPYRELAPNCHSWTGLLGPSIPYQPTGYENKVGLWCTKQDVFCSGTIDFTDIATDHMAYEPDGIIEQAAITIVAKALQNIHATAYGITVSDDDVSYSTGGETYSPGKVITTADKFNAIGRQDLALVIDTTASMNTLIDKFRRAAGELAEKVIAAGGRVAIYEYRDLNMGFRPRQVTDFTTDIDNIKALLKSLKCVGGGDLEESALSAILTAMNNLHWHSGITKSLLLLTDDGFHDPDYDEEQTTLDKVIQRSLEIDPVNIYTISPNTEEYQKLTASTGGQIYSIDDSTTYIDAIANAPAVTMPLAEYTAAPGEEITFSVDTNAEVTKYEWDLDFDAEFELETTTPYINYTYTAPTAGYMQARITDVSGHTNIASAKVLITNATEQLPELSNTRYTLHDDETSSTSVAATVEFDTSDNTAYTLVAGNDTIYGLVEGNTLTVTDLDRSTPLTLVPVSSSGLQGASVQVEFPDAPAGEELNISLFEMPEGNTGTIVDSPADASTDDSPTENALDNDGQSATSSDLNSSTATTDATFNPGLGASTNANSDSTSARSTTYKAEDEASATVIPKAPNSGAK